MLLLYSYVFKVLVWGFQTLDNSLTFRRKVRKWKYICEFLLAGIFKVIQRVIIN